MPFSRHSVRDHIDFDEELDESYTEEPLCDVTRHGAAASRLLDRLLHPALRGDADAGRTLYEPEAALSDALQRLGGRGNQAEAVDAVGTRIARALDKVRGSRVFLPKKKKRLRKKIHFKLCNWIWKE